MRSEPSFWGRALQIDWACVAGRVPRLYPARTRPLESTATPFRSPPLKSASLSSVKRRVPTAKADTATSAADRNTMVETERRNVIEVLVRGSADHGPHHDRYFIPSHEVLVERKNLPNVRTVRVGADRCRRRP